MATKNSIGSVVNARRNRPREWHKHEGAANWRLFKRQLCPGLLAQNRVRTGARCETALGLALVVPDLEFTVDVAKIRNRYPEEWRRLPKGEILRRDRLGLEGLRGEISRICARYGIDGVAVFDQRFLPWIARPYSVTPALGTGLVGLLRSNSVSRHHRQGPAW